MKLIIKYLKIGGKAMPLQNKYLKYSPEITLEVFTLIWDKLIELGFKPKNNNINSEFNAFLDEHNYLIINSNQFNTYLELCIFDNTETTVQEILGYDPFVKEVIEEVIPEYVEYIDTKYKGQIVKVEEWTNHNFCCIRFENGQREQPFKDLVKLSTKEAYEAQNKPKQLTVSDLIEGEIYKTNYKEQGDYIPSIIKKQTKLQTITIESPIHLELNLTKIKSKQIQTIKI